ncbi:MAG: radical SAM protein [bacterium]
MILKNSVNLIKAKIFRSKIPLIVGWAITYRCNRQCQYCSLNKKTPGELQTQQVFAVIDEMKSMGTSIISFTGGEPLMRDDMGAIIEYAYAQGIKVKLNTNGSLIHKNIQQLKGIHVLNISFDGPEKIHDAIRGKGSFNEVMESARIAVAHKIRLSFTTVLSNQNLNGIDFVLQKAKEYNSPVNFQPVTPHILGSSRPNPLMPEEHEYRAVIKKLMLLRRSSNLIANSSIGLAHLLNWPRGVRMNCASGWISCRIEPNGDVIHCSRITKPNSLNCVTHGFKAAFLNLDTHVCDTCMCGSRVELNLLWSGNVKYIYERILHGSGF